MKRTIILELDTVTDHVEVRVASEMTANEAAELLALASAVLEKQVTQGAALEAQVQHSRLLN